MIGDRRTTGTAVPKIILTGTPILRTFAGMITPDDIFRITAEAAFEAAALEVFRRQAAAVSYTHLRDLNKNIVIYRL